MNYLKYNVDPIIMTRYIKCKYFFNKKFTFFVRIEKLRIIAELYMENGIVVLTDQIVQAIMKLNLQGGYYHGKNAERSYCSADRYAD